jgi:ribose/xylose/arabinose/galactoside ABC-type transport system permease subunit
LGTSAYWEQALQGVVILAAITIEALRSRLEKREAGLAAHRV